jgi:uncharacterized membrane protein YciS (DUF1049 family)
MRRLLAWILLLPLSIVVILFAVANRPDVTVSFDPFSREPGALSLTLPLFAVIFIAVIVGVLIGGITVSLGKLRWRIAARRAERENERLKTQAQHQAEAEFRAVSSVPDLPDRRF